MKNQRRAHWVDMEPNRKLRGQAPDIPSYIRSAESMVILAGFLSGDSAILDAVERAHYRGVRCYIVTGAEPSMQYSKACFGKDEYAQCIRAMQDMSEYALIRSASDFRASAILTDPYTQPKGMLLGAGLIGGTSGQNQLWVRLTEKEMGDAANILRWAFWERARHELDMDESRFGDIKPLGELDPVKSNRILQTARHAKSIRGRIRHILSKNPKTVVASSWAWDHPGVVGRLCGLARKGSDVTVVTRQHGNIPNELMRMLMAGIRVVGCSGCGATALVTESDTLITSANMDREGLERGFELGISINDERAEEIRQTVRDWAKNPQQELRYRKHAKRRAKEQAKPDSTPARLAAGRR